MKNELFLKFEKQYGKAADGYVQSGGRFEMLGNHTDHNHGKTLASTCSLVIEGAYSKEDNNLVRLVSEGQCEFEISLDNTDYVEETVDKSACFIRGIADYLKKHGYAYGGFSVYTKSSVPPGAGVSSSAAFEILLGKIFNALYNNDQIDMGVSYIDFGNIEKPKIEIIHNSFPGYQFVIVDTGKSHAELSHLYSSITSDMWNAAKKMGHEFLRECSREELENKKSELTEGEYNRAKHFFDENERVEKGLNCLKNDDFAGFLECVRGSEASSRNLLKNAMVDDVYEETAPYDPDDFGFGGSIICIVPDSKISQYMRIMYDRYGKNHVFNVSILNEVKE